MKYNLIQWNTWRHQFVSETFAFWDLTEQQGQTSLQVIGMLTIIKVYYETMK
jgi:hypothetical protein